MKITIEFKDDNAAFQDGGSEEYRGILRQALDAILTDYNGAPLRDSNGNLVGRVVIERY